MANPISFVSTERGARKAICNGYAYTMQRKATGEKFSQWCCVRRHDCKGRLWISPDEREWIMKKEHTHPPNFGYVKALVAVQGIKRRAADEPHTDPCVITQAALTAVDSETVLSLPKEDTLKRSIRRARNQHHPALPCRLEDVIEIPEPYSLLNGENWVLYDNGQDADHRVILFGSRRTLQDMGNSRRWYGDGTFKSRPKIAAQLYILHYEKNGQVFPGFYYLMADRTEDSYIIAFRALHDILPPQSVGPQKFSVDFELAASNAFRTVFPQSAEEYCFFHFSQALWRKAQGTGMANTYMADDGAEIRAQFHAALALAFVPEQDVAEALQDLREAADEALDEVLDHLEDYYVMGRRRGRGRRPPRYPVASWNVYQRTLDGVPRTNNCVEAWNRRWNILVGKAHPNIYVFLEALKAEEHYILRRREASDLGRSPPAKKPKHRQHDDRLQRLCLRYNDMIQERGANIWETGILKYLRTVGHSAMGILHV